uniref:Uncharacterized protein n=1 Tax=Lotus japonicus TaxID=34305 RepID=I3S0U8_LOTJA|nr:unknown [Lotus japonicus]
MASCIPNSLSFQGRKTSPNCLFGWNIGRKGVADNKPQINYHDIDLTFSTSLVDKTFLKGKELKCCYRATIDGFSAVDFHNCCDFKGPCVIIGYTNKISSLVHSTLKVIGALMTTMIHLIPFYFIGQTLKLNPSFYPRLVEVVQPCLIMLAAGRSLGPMGFLLGLH